MASLHISISAETVFHVGSVAVTNSMFTSLFASVLLIILSLAAYRATKYTNKPTGLQNFLEMLIEALEGLTNSITGSAIKTRTIFPFVLCFFLFIATNNWLGLLPGVGTIGFMEQPEATHEEEVAPEHSLKNLLIPSALATETSSEISSSTTTVSTEKDSPSIFMMALPSILSIIVIILSMQASKHAKTLTVPTGIQNFLEALVEKTKNLLDGYQKAPKFVKRLINVAVILILVAQVLITTGLSAKLFAPKAPEGEAKTEQVKRPAVKPVKIAPAKEEGHAEGPKFVPYFRAGTADLNTTLALALISVIATQVVGFKYLGIHYFNKFVNFKSPIDAFVGLLETVSEISKIISFSFRLFGNVFAGEVLLAVIAFLIPVVIPMPFIGLEIFVGTIQAFVFATLTLVFMNLATQGHGDHEAAGAHA